MNVADAQFARNQSLPFFRAGNNSRFVVAFEPFLFGGGQIGIKLVENLHVGFVVARGVNNGAVRYEFVGLVETKQNEWHLGFERDKIKTVFDAINVVARALGRDAHVNCFVGFQRIYYRRYQVGGFVAIDGVAPQSPK